jgi:hypothetical protein
VSGPKLGVRGVTPAAFEEQVQNNVIQVAVIVCRSCFHTMQFAWAPIEAGKLPPKWLRSDGDEEADL